MTLPPQSTPVRRAGLSLPFLAAVSGLFFVSGACGLLYQVVWTRRLVLLFGTTSQAVSAVLTVFFLGLGLGAFFGGRLADRTPRPLRWYGFFEVLIGVWAVAFLFCLNAGEAALADVLLAAHGAPALGIALRGTLAVALLFVPVFLMGATLPLLVRAVHREQHLLGVRLGALYSVNTLGAVAGCALTGFVLIPQFGYLRTTLAGAAANGLIGFLAIALAQWRKSDACCEVVRSAETEQAAGLSTHRPLWRITAAYGLVGFCMLALEVVWTRLLVIVFLGTTYAYTTMLAALLCGIALGSAAAAGFVDRLRRPVAVFGGVVALLGIACLFTLGWFADLPDKLIAAQREYAQDWNGETLAKFKLAFSVLFIPTVLSGMAFPLAARALGVGRNRIGRQVGRLYAANTLGGVLGAAIGGFVLLPMLGSHDTTLLLGCLLIAAGSYVLRACPVTPARQHWGVAAFLFAPLLAIAWSNMPDDVNRALNKGYVPKDHRVLYCSEGVEGTVAVSEPVDEESGTNRVLWINRVQATASIERGVRMNRFQGALPLLFDRDPAHVLFMCFGSGITAGTLALSDFAQIDVVELSPDVIDAASLFAVDNLDVLGRPAVRVHVDDGRNHLLMTPDHYDLISFEPMPLAVSGVSAFYTREYYALCRARLNPGGLVSQWVPLHSLNPEVVRSLVCTFLDVFPDSCAFFINADLFLLGSDRPLRLDYAKAKARLAKPELHAALAAAGLCDAEEVLGSFVMGPEQLRRFAEGGRIMRDDRPWAEFEAPKLVYAGKVIDSLRLLAGVVESPAPYLADGAGLEAVQRRFDAHRNDFTGLFHYYGGINIGTEAAKAFIASLRLDPGDCNARYYLRELISAQCPQYLDWQKYQEVVDLLSAAAEVMPDVPAVELYLARGLAGLAREDEAKAHYARYLELGGTPQADLAAL